MLPQDIWHLIFRYLLSTQIATFQFVSKNLQTYTNAYMQYPDFWQPLFNQLSFMPPYNNIKTDPFSLQNIDYNNIDYRKYFKDRFFSVVLQQKTEWATLAHSKWTMAHMIPAKKQTGSLKELLSRNQCLDKISAENIVLCQNEKDLLGRIKFLPITRLPYHLKDEMNITNFLNNEYKNIFITTFHDFLGTAIGHDYQLIPYGVDINALNEQGQTSLHSAVLVPDIFLIQRLLLAKANINAKDIDNLTPLHAYIKKTPKENFNVNFVKYLINEAGAEFDTIDKFHFSPLTTLIYRAAFGTLEMSKVIEVIQFLIDSKKCNINLANTHGNTALHMAIIYACDIYSVNCGPMVYFLINSCHANVEALNNAKQTPLMIAIYQDTKASPVVVADLLLLGANGHITDEAGLTLLHHIALTCHYYGYLNKIVSLGIDINTPTREGRTPLHLAVFSGSLPKVKFIINHLNANILALDNTGKTPLHVAAEIGDLEITQWLVDNTKSSMYVTDDTGHTPYQLAYQKNNILVCQYLRGKEIGLEPLLRETAKPIVDYFDKFCADLSNALPSFNNEQNGPNNQKRFGFF